jgi:hypothetical protein
MKLRHLLLVPLACLCVVAQAVEIEGVQFEDKATLAKTELVLNGAGLRKKVFFDVYAIGLYLPGKKSTTADILALKGPQHLRIVTLRDLTAEQFADALVEGLHKNHQAAELETLKARIDTFSNILRGLKAAPKGSSVVIDWLPESGTRLTFNGERRGEDIPGEDFHRALLRVWIGDKPAQDSLKDALLGKPQ